MATTSIESLAREITTKLGGILAVRIYLGVADSAGNIIYADSELVQFQSFISTFVKHLEHLDLSHNQIMLECPT